MQDMTKPSVQVALMNNAFNNPMGNIDTPNWEAIDRQYAIFMSEVNELGAAIVNRQIHGVKGIRDGIADVQVTNLGLAHVIGINSDADMLEVFNSNMSKFVTNEQELIQTVEKYAAIGVKIYSEGEYPRKCLKSAADQTATTGEFFKKGKFLKGINFQEPNLGTHHG